MPLLLYSRDTEIVEHPLLTLLGRPSPGMPGTDLLESFFGFLLVSGNGYIEAAGLGGEVRELHALRPDRVKVIPGPDGWPEAFEYAAGGAKVRIAGEPAPGVRAVLHMKLFHPANDHYGLSPIEAAAAAIDLHNAAARWNKALLDNSARPSGALVYSNGQQMTAEQFERLKSELEASFQGTRNAGRPLLLEGGLDWKAMSLTPRDLDFMEAKHAAAREIALAIGVPPMLLGIPGDNTYANYAEANRAFWRQTVLPLVQRTARALTLWLTPAYGHELRFSPDLDQVEALSPERDALWSRLERTSFLSDAEKRAAVGYGDKPEGGDGANRPFARKYREDQARDDQGRWVDEGGGSGGDQSGSPEETDEPSDGEPLLQPVQFSPQNRGWHDYNEGPNVVCRAELRCTEPDMVEYLSRFAVPGQDPSRPVTDGDRSLVYDPRTGLPAGWVDTEISEGGRTITNHTLPLHIFYNGKIERSIQPNEDGSWSVNTRGTGNNVIPGFSAINAWQGPLVFREVDRQMRSYIERDRRGR